MDKHYSETLRINNIIKFSLIVQLSALKGLMIQLQTTIVTFVSLKVCI